ncbi:MAG: ferritin [Planctomycetia bacterium]|jgi:ferritin
MLSEKMTEALNAQINAEYYSSYLYLSMAAWAEEQNLPGFGNWFRVQAQEEMFHAMKIFDFVIERGGRVTLTAIDGPETEWATPTAAFEATLKHEQHVTSLINKLVDLALAESDHATNTFLQWFVTEQVEEEASADAILSTIQRMGDAKGGLFMLDRELSQRVYTPPATAE